MNSKPRKFSWYDGYTTALMRIDDEDVRKDLAWQLIMFGAYGIEPDFTRYDYRYELAAEMVFDIARHTINKSAANAANGSKPSKTGRKRGRPTKEEQERRRLEEEKAAQALAILEAGEEGWFIPAEIVDDDPDAYLEGTI